MPISRTSGYAMTISRRLGESGWVRVALRKHWWTVDAGTRSRQVAETGFYAEGMGERDIVESALRELLRAWVDDQA